MKTQTIDVLEEARLFEQFKLGDERAFTKLYHRLKHYPYLIAKNMLIKREDAEDIAMETFSRAWINKSKINSFAHLKSWICLTARRFSIDKIRHSHRLIELTDQDISSEPSYDSEQEIIKIELVEKIFAAYKTFHPNHKKIFELHFFGTKSLPEISRLLNIKMQTVYNAMYTMKTKIKEINP